MSVAFVQRVPVSSTVAGQTTTGAVGGTFAAGNLIVAIVAWSYSGAGASATIDVPSGWTAPLATKNNGAPNGASRVYFLPNNPGGAQTWTWTVTMGGGGAAQSWSVTFVEISGTDLASPLDLTAVSNATGAASSTSLDTLAASGTTQPGDMLLELVAVDRSAAGVNSTDTTNSVPTTGWTVLATTTSSNGVPNCSTAGQYNVLAGTQAAPRGVLTSTITESSESFLLTFRAAVAFLVQPGRAMNQSREWLLIYRVRRRRSSDVIRPQVNPPISPDWWRRAFQVQARKFLRRGPFRYDLPIRPQLNPPMPPVRWTRPFIGFLRAIGPRRAKRFDVIRAQVNPPMPPTWWSRSFQAQLRRFVRRGRLSEPPWGQAAAAPNPSFSSWAGRLRRAQGWLRPRKVLPQVRDGAQVIQGVRRGRLSPVLRRARVSGRPLVAVIVAAPAFIAQHARRVRPVTVRVSRRVFLPPFAATVAPVLAALQNFIDSVQSSASVAFDAVTSLFSSNAGSVSADSLQGPSKADTTEGGPGINSEVEGR